MEAVLVSVKAKEKTATFSLVTLSKLLSSQCNNFWICCLSLYSFLSNCIILPDVLCNAVCPKLRGAPQMGCHAASAPTGCVSRLVFPKMSAIRSQPAETIWGFFVVNLSHSCSDPKGSKSGLLKEKWSDSHLMGSFSPSFGRITQCPMALFCISMQKTTCCVSLVPFLCCFSVYIFRFLAPLAFVFFLLPQPSAWPISVRLLSCTILNVLASRYSSVTLLPLALPLASPPPSVLLHVVKTLYISLKHSF